MRMRPKKNREKRMDKVKDLFVRLDGNGFIDIKNAFGNEEAIDLEIGCGKGAFIKELALREPDKHFVAAELVPDVLMMAMEKALESGLPNLRFLHCNADVIDAVIPPESVKTLYLNFSDPWPKKRNAKRRLTSPLFLERYKNILTRDGRIVFKTDNKELFDYSLETFTGCGYKVTDVCFDLHGDPVLSKTNIETEYEKNFSAKGFLINTLTAYL